MAGYEKGFDMPLYYWVGGALPGSKELTEAVAVY